MPISAPGLGSGIDVNGIISQLMAIERRPVDLLDQKEAGIQAKLSAYGTLKGALSEFQTAMQGLNTLGKFQGRTAKSSDDGVFTATASSTAVSGQYSVEVKQLAQSHKLASKAFTATTDAVGTGTLTIQFGTFSAGTFTVNAQKTAQTVTIGSGANTLAGIRDAINTANIGVSASILNDGTGNRLVITSTDTGAASSLKITVSDTSDASNTDDAGLSQLAYDPAGTPGAGKNLAETVAAQNALLKVDGVDNIAKSANVVTDVIQGVTLNLVAKSATGVPASLKIERDTASIKTAVEEFISTYNDLNKTVRELTTYNAETKQGAVLQGDASALSIVARIRRVLGSPLTGASGTLTTLSSIGVAFQKDGTLALDAAKLDTALNTNLDGVAALFAVFGRASDSLVSYSSSTGKTAAGVYALDITQVAARGLLNGATTAGLAETGGTFTAPVVIDASNDTLAIKLDGAQSGTVTLTQGSYTTVAALIAELQSKINADATLKGAGATVTVSYDGTNDRVVLTSDKYGAASSVEITSVDTNTAATLGLSVATGTAGADVVGTIGGLPATGSGRFLTGSGGNVAGLKLEILGGATGDRGTINFARGYAAQLDSLAEDLLGDGGPLDSRTDGLNAVIADIGRDRTNYERRLEATEKRLRAQFTALDTLVSQLKATSDYLTNNLSKLPLTGQQGS